ncbi:modification methylase MjaVI (N-4 cytosine-specificmethyltransferase MjaVI) (M.MjaVI) [Sulfurihydrogenibium azorense Az-Fu1]|jgi:site-specific DNA-methyltransferase (adenine-specific)|uniref:Methyltransferase n=1 Tax=Sulfurihydrogenibium azorense (strain DSM 15241 / OCM 825 / Az-Fu1) TaxID=204536 RepID=C1DXD7_SULAA|nr:site-specific DNA-methyltransferase [Sulfurihydrogenibium azorense]ACN98523.1 modification methylase MjaVI (N-4 cytosine-specificmethyltransferase MjaVI) (M.MjaVI) [Sulfurihydrogenibium azorense Az-Fu1]
MKYLTGKENKEIKIRLNYNTFEKLKEVSFKKEISLNFLINQILEKEINESNYEKDIKNYFKEKPELIFSNDKIKLFHNDFIEVDLSDYKGKVNLIITSPPYNVGIEYGKHNDAVNYEDYLSFTEKWLYKSYELLADDGRACINIPLDKNRNGLKPVYADFINIAKKVGFNYQSTIVWNEQNVSKRTAWGSWLSASAPYVIAPVEMIVVLYKKQWKRINKGESTITREEFIQWTNGVWNFSGESKKRVGHPAPFPLELPKRCIKLFSYKDDLVLDPFSGSGTTLIAAFKEERRAIGVEIDKNYIDLSVERLTKEISKPQKNLLNID